MTDQRLWTCTSAGDRVTLALSGRFDFNRYADFRLLASQALALPGGREILVNLAAVDYLDSSALGMLLNLNDQAKALGRRVVLANASGMVQQILEIAHFQALFELR